MSTAGSIGRLALRDPRLRAGLALLGAGSALAVRMAISHAPVSGEAAVARQLQDIPGIARLAEAVNAFGEYQWYVLLALAVLLFAGRRFERRAMPGAITGLLFAVAIAAVLLEGDHFLKQIVRSPRPSAAYGIDLREIKTTFGFPSGHVYGDMLAYGLVTASAWRLLPRTVAIPVATAGIVLLLLAGPARVIAGAHWPTDVAGGYLLGGAALCLALAGGDWLAARTRQEQP